MQILESDRVQRGEVLRESDGTSAAHLAEEELLGPVPAPFPGIHRLGGTQATKGSTEDVLCGGTRVGARDPLHSDSDVGLMGLTRAAHRAVLYLYLPRRTGPGGNTARMVREELLGLREHHVVVHISGHDHHRALRYVLGLVEPFDVGDRELFQALAAAADEVPVRRGRPVQA